jgi:hypothetical protein
MDPSLICFAAALPCAISESNCSLPSIWANPCPTLGATPPMPSAAVFRTGPTKTLLPRRRRPVSSSARMAGWARRLQPSLRRRPSTSPLKPGLIADNTPSKIVSYRFVLACAQAKTVKVSPSLSKVTPQLQPTSLTGGHRSLVSR